MRILIVAATQKEIALLQENLDEVKKKHEILFCITGVGLVPTVFELTNFLAADNTFDLILNLGIAGAIDKSLKLGEVLEVKSDTFYNWGAEDHSSFISVFDLGLISPNEVPFINGELNATSLLLNHFKKVTSISVQLVHGNAQSIDKLLSNTAIAQIESMEGAAVFYVSLKYNLPVMQLRAISNYVEPRNRNNWNISLAINNLNKAALEFLVNYNSH